MSSLSDRSWLKVEHTEEGVVVRLIGCDMLDEKTALVVREQLHSLAEGLGPAVVFLELGNLRFLSSTGLGVLVGLNTKLKARGGRLTVRGVNPDIHEVFEVTSLTQLLDVRQQNGTQPERT